MAWLNELGAVAVAARTQDIGVARCRRLEPAAPTSFMDAVESMRLEFVSVPGMGHVERPASVVQPSGGSGRG